MMTYKVFIEYKIYDSKRELFLGLIPLIKQLHETKLKVDDYQIYEGVYQKSIFVEEFLIHNIDEFQIIKEIRQTSHAKVWQEFTKCVVGERKKINMWVFSKVNF